MISALSLRQVAKNRWPDATRRGPTKVVENVQGAEETDEHFAWRTAPENALAAPEILCTDHRGLHVLGWSGYAKPVVDFVNTARGHGDQDRTRLAVLRGPGQRRVAVFSEHSDFKIAKRILLDLGGIVPEVGTPDQ